MARKRKKKKAETTKAPPDPPVGGVPNAQTLYRAQIVDAVSYKLIAQAQRKVKPLLWLRDGGDVKTIRSASTPEELLDLIPLATGLGEAEWHARMRGFGPQVLPLIGAHLKAARDNQGVELRDRIYELLISDLRWRDQEGAQTLLESFDRLDDYGKSLASLTLGLLKAGESADRIWDYYQKVVRNTRENLFVGALWGLIDLGDPRAAGALYEFLVRQRYFSELMGFLSLAGDQRSLVPLLVLGAELDEDDRWDPFLAAVAIVHRVGRDATFKELREHSPKDEKDEALETMIEHMMSRPIEDVEEYFALFYRGFRPEDVSDPFEMDN
jgi:hypothetical protein